MGRLLRPLLLLTAVVASSAVQSQTNVSFPELAKRAAAGDAAAEFEVGRAYEDGKGVQQNDDLAVQWFRKAAEQGNARAQNSLGVMYSLGRGVQRNRQEAVRWYRKAAKQGLSEGLYNVAISYFNGEGVGEDMTAAYAWMLAAQARGDTQAGDALPHITEELRGHLEEGKLRLAEMYAKGVDLPQDFAAAAGIYQGLAALGSRQGFSYAQSEFKLCELYASGRGVPLDLAEARSRCRLAGKNGVGFAYVVLGRMAVKGVGETQDLAEAESDYRNAIVENVPDGYLELGKLKLQSGSHDDAKEAYFWFYLAQRLKISGADEGLSSAAAQLSDKEIAAAQKKTRDWYRMNESEKRKKKIKIR